MRPLPFAFAAIASLVLVGCSDLQKKSDAGTDGGDAGGDAAVAGGPGAPVIDSVVLPQSATIDTGTGSAQISGAVSFHDDSAVVTTLNIVVHAPSGASAYPYAIPGYSPQTIQLEIKQPGTIEVDVSLTDQKGLSSLPFAQLISVTQ